MPERAYLAVDRSQASNAPDIAPQVEPVGMHDACFLPRWRPKFITALAGEDRCHLNGLAIVDGRPKFASALGETDTANGWRANKPHGGCLIDIGSGETVARSCRSAFAALAMRRILVERARRNGRLKHGGSSTSAESAYLYA
jgi:hypothetical protein